MTLVKLSPGFSKTHPVWKNIWSPFSDEFFRNPVSSNTSPAVNIKETPAAFLLEVAAPGLAKEDFKVKVEKDILSISAKKEVKAETEGQTWTRKEFNYSSFERNFRLPETVAMESILAKYENGVLFIEIPKLQAAKENSAREITIG